jgi:hypothetical protein
MPSSVLRSRWQVLVLRAGKIIYFNSSDVDLFPHVEQLSCHTSAHSLCHNCADSFHRWAGGK